MRNGLFTSAQKLTKGSATSA